MKVKTKAKLLSPLLIIAMVVSLMAGALMVAPQVAEAGPNGDPPYFEIEGGTLNFTPTSAHEGILDADLYGTNDGIPLGTYCVEADFDIAMESWIEECPCAPPEMTGTGHFSGTAEFIYTTPALILDGTITLSDGCVIPPYSLSVSEGMISLDAAPDTPSNIIPWDPDTETGSYLYTDGMDITFTAGTVTRCPQLDVDVGWDGPHDPIHVSDTFKVWAVVNNTGTATATDVVAHIEVYGDASLVDGESPDKLLGDGNIAVGGQSGALWTLHCDESGWMYIVVTATETGVLEPATDSAGVGPKQQIEVPLPNFYVVIDSPSHGDTFSCDSVGLHDQLLGATATVYNDTGETVEDISVTISGAGISTETETIASIANGGNASVTFDTAACISPGITTVVVTATGTGDPSEETYTDGDSIYVYQQEKAHLVAELVSPYGDTFSCCDFFPVLVYVANTGEAAATAVNVTVNVTGNLEPSGTLGPFYLDTIPGGQAKTVDPMETIFYCYDAGDVTFEIYDDPLTPLVIEGLQGTDANTGEAIPVDNITVPDPLTLHQVPLVVWIDYYPDDVNVSDEFIIDARIYNCCDETVATDVTATIHIDGPADLVEGESATKTIGTVLPGCEYQPVGWVLHCDSYGPVIITVSTTGIVEVEGESVGTGDGEEDTFYLANIPVVAATEIIYLNEVATTAYTLNDATGEITFDDPVPNLVDITADYDWAFSVVTSKPVTVIQHGAVLEVELDSDYPVYICDDFTVNATIWNNGDVDAKDVIATLSVTEGEENVEVISDLIQPVVGPILYDGDPGEASWKVHCLAEGDVTFEVTVAGMEEDEFIPIPSVDLRWLGHPDMWPPTIIVEQGLPPPELIVIIESPLDEYTWIGTGQEFMVTAKLYNPSDTTLENVTATISFPFPDWWDEDEWPGIPPPLSVADATIEVDSIAGQGYEFVTWTVQADWAGIGSLMPISEVEIQVDAVGYDADTPDADPITDDDSVGIYVYPAAYLVVDIGPLGLDGSTLTVCDEFDVTATVTNTGWADAWDVSLTLSTYPEGSVVLMEGGYTQNVGCLAGHSQDGSATVTWKVHCKQSCSTTITVTAQGQDEVGFYGDYDCGSCNPGASILDKFIENDSITVKQYDGANLVVDISYPDEIVDGQDYAVTAVISNTGDKAAAGVTATLTIAGHASLLTGEYLTQTIGTIAAGSSATVEWVLHADDEGGVNLAVSATGTGINTASDSGAVQQAAAPAAPLAPAGYGGLIGGIIGGFALLGIIIFVGLFLRRSRA